MTSHQPQDPQLHIELYWKKQSEWVTEFFEIGMVYINFHPYYVGLFVWDHMILQFNRLRIKDMYNEKHLAYEISTFEKHHLDGWSNDKVQPIRSLTACLLTLLN